MRLSNKAKHELAIKLISDYLMSNGYEHLVFSSDKCLDIYIPVSDTKVKVFCNYSGSENLKVSSDFESHDDVLYLVVKPTKKNIHGFTYVGGDKSVIDKSIKNFDTEDSPKNIQTDLLRIISITKLIEQRRQIIEQEEGAQLSFTCLSPNISASSVKKCRTAMVGFYKPVSVQRHLIAQH